MLLYAHICDYIRIYAVICTYSAYKYLPKMGQPDFVLNFENFDNHNFGVESEVFTFIGAWPSLVHTRALCKSL